MTTKRKLVSRKGDKLAKGSAPKRPVLIQTKIRQFDPEFDGSDNENPPTPKRTSILSQVPPKVSAPITPKRTQILPQTPLVSARPQDFVSILKQTPISSQQPSIPASAPASAPPAPRASSPASSFSPTYTSTLSSIPSPLSSIPSSPSSVSSVSPPPKCATNRAAAAAVAKPPAPTPAITSTPLQSLTDDDDDDIQVQTLKPTATPPISLSKKPTLPPESTEPEVGTATCPISLSQSSGPDEPPSPQKSSETSEVSLSPQRSEASPPPPSDSKLSPPPKSESTCSPPRLRSRTRPKPKPVLDPEPELEPQRPKPKPYRPTCPTKTSQSNTFQANTFQSQSSQFQLRKLILLPPQAKSEHITIAQLALKETHDSLIRHLDKLIDNHDKFITAVSRGIDGLANVSQKLAEFDKDPPSFE